MDQSTLVNFWYVLDRREGESQDKVSCCHGFDTRFRELADKLDPTDPAQASFADALRGLANAADKISRAPQPVVTVPSWRQYTGGNVPWDWEGARLWLSEYLDQTCGPYGLPPKEEIQ